MDDLISRQAAIDAFLTELTKRERKNLLHTWSTVEVKYFVVDMLEKLPSAQPEKRTEERAETHACDLIDREAAVDAIYHHLPSVSRTRARTMLHEVPSARPEQPLYVAEIEAEYQKAVKMPHIHKPLAKALYEVWKKHDREDAERRTDG